MIDKWQQREAKIGRTNIGRLMDKTSDGQLKSVQSRHLKHLITVCTVRIQSQNIPDAVRYAAKQKKRYYLGIFPKRRTPPPPPPFGNPLS